MAVFAGRTNFLRLVGLGCSITAVMLVLILVSFDPRDPSFFSDIAPSRLPQTVGGWWGATIGDFIFRAFGASAYLLSPFLLLVTLYLWRFAWADLTRLIGGGIVLLLAVFMGGSVVNDPTVGGYLGQAFYRSAATLIDPFSLSVLTGVIGAIGLICLIRFRWAVYVSRFFALICRWTGIVAICRMLSRAINRPAIWAGRQVTMCMSKLFGRATIFATTAAEDDQSEDNSMGAMGVSPFIPSSIIQSSGPEPDQDQTYLLPLEVLFSQENSTHTESSETKSVLARDTACRDTARALEAKLRQFGIEGSVVSITAGPTVALFSYKPATDVKVSRIVALEDDLALAIEARSLRVIAPMPGTAYVGFEVANRASEPVFFADLVTQKVFRDPIVQLPLLLGKNSTGADRVIDLASQPHLLIAGSTGSGKSVALHGMLAGLLSSRSPDALRIVLIDPKRLEFAGYADVAHLLVPIVTDGLEACRVLRFLTKTMESRYQQMAQAGVRNIQEFHRVYSGSEMPYIVVVIDELADLMMVAGKELDLYLIRLAQMARAAGIHLIVATQRPSVDVLTGLVKVNFPARIAFKVASKTDARTILDQSGAEKLLGRGDMLLLDPQGNLERIQGALVRDQEIKDIVSCIKSQRSTDYVIIPDEQTAGQESGESDPLLPQVVDFVRTVEEISISLIQRRFRIGYNRSARLVDQLENRGIILPAQGGKMRRVARDSSIA